MQKTKPIIELNDAGKTYQMGAVEVPALRGVNLKIHPGEFVSIMGPSGSGKSTMMNLVGCLDLPTKGSIYLDGQNIAHMPESKLAQIRGRKIGFVFQKFNLLSTLTAWENVALPMVFQGVSKDERRARAKKLLSSVGLAERVEHLPGEMSGGEQQRVAIARALANDPEVMLADEPTGNLDSKTGAEVITILQDLHKKGKTIIVVTHDSAVARFAERTIHIKDGQVLKEVINGGGKK